jgi:hypothetical protein
MKSQFLLSSLAMGLGLATAASVAVAQEPAKESVKGRNVTISGCVITDKEQSFVLTHVQELAGPSTTAPSATLDGMAGLKGGTPGVIYWLSSDSVKLMRGHVGHKVQVMGEITDLSTGTVRVQQEPGKDGPDNKVEVTARDKDSGGKTDQPVVTGPTGKTDTTTTLPVRRIKVDTVKMLSTTCP